MTTLRLGTRKSALAQAQTNAIADRLRQSFPGLLVELILITTRGDRGESSDSTQGGLKTLFTKELEDALLDGRIDLAVHSLKDMAGDLPPGLTIGAVPEREDPRDAWISKDKTPFKSLRPGAKVGTGAVRRQAQLKHARPDLDIVPMRGNVDTRLRKLSEDGVDGIILAMAGLKRLGLAAQATETLASDIMLPAVGQGCLAIEVRENNAGVKEYLNALDHKPSHAAAIAERSFLQTLGGSCQTPIAAFAQVSGTIQISGLVAAPDGSQILRDKVEAPLDRATFAGEHLANNLLKAGAGNLLKI